MGVFKRRQTKTPIWYIDYKLDGKRKHEAIGKVCDFTKKEVLRILLEREEQIYSGSFILPKNKIPRYRQFSDEYISYKRDVEKKKSLARDISALKHLIPFFGDMRLNEIKPYHIDQYKVKRQGSVSSSTVNKELEVLRAMFYLAERWERYQGKNPVRISGLIPVNNQVERILSQDEEKRLLDVCPAHLANIVVFALNTGMRKFEILTLKWTNVDLKSRVMTLDLENTKSKRKRKIPINSVVKNVLYSLKFKERLSEYVFLNSNNEPYKRQDSLNNVWRAALRNAEISGLRFHDLRHTAATRMVERCGNIVAVSKILGHANISNTMRYCHPDKSLEDALESLVDEKVLAILLATGKKGNMQERKSP